MHIYFNPKIILNCALILLFFPLRDLLDFNRIRFHLDLSAIQPEPDYHTLQFEMGSTASSFKGTSLRWGRRPNNKMLYHSQVQG